MSKPDLRPTPTLELLAALQKTTSTFARREEVLAREIANRRHAIQRQHRDAVTAAEERLAQQVESAEAEAQEGRERVTALYGERRTRVTRAAAAALRKLPLRARQHKERWMGNLQLRQFQCERKLETDQKAADTALAEFTAQLGEIQARLRKVRQRARQAFAGYLSFLRLLRPRPGTAPVPANREDGLRECQILTARAEDQLVQFRQQPLPKIFRVALPPVVFPLLLVLGFILAVSLSSPANVVAAAGVGVTMLVLGGTALSRPQERETAGECFVSDAG